MQKATLLLISLLALTLVSAQTINQCLKSRLDNVKAGKTRMRGVGLGSWFILEGWISASLWSDNGCSMDQVQGTWQFEQCLGDRAQDVMEQHWNTWITEDDFKQMSDMGINAIRLPVGWWQIYDQFGGVANAKLNYYVTPTNFVVGSLKYVDKALEWALKYGIGVIIDLHAAPGSQNGVDNSSPSVTGQIYWDKYTSNQYETVDAMGLYAERYGDHEAVLAFQLMNDPDVNINALQTYHVSAYNRIRQFSDAPIVINSLINPLQTGTEDAWKNFMNPDQYENVWMDFHLYHCQGGPFDPSNPDSVINYIKTGRKQQLESYNQVNPKPMIVGGWSACGVPENRAADIIRAQLDVYAEAKGGWFMWTWKNPSYSVWSLQNIYQNGWIQKSDFAESC